MLPENRTVINAGGPEVLTAQRADSAIGSRLTGFPEPLVTPGYPGSVCTRPELRSFPGIHLSVEFYILRHLTLQSQKKFLSCS